MLSVTFGLLQHCHHLMYKSRQRFDFHSWNGACCLYYENEFQYQKTAEFNSITNDMNSSGPHTLTKHQFQSVVRCFSEWQNVWSSPCFSQCRPKTTEIYGTVHDTLSQLGSSKWWWHVILPHKYDWWLYKVLLLNFYICKVYYVNTTN